MELLAIAAFGNKKAPPPFSGGALSYQSGRLDLNQRPPAPEAGTILNQSRQIAGLQRETERRNRFSKEDKLAHWTVTETPLQSLIVVNMCSLSLPSSGGRH